MVTSCIDKPVAEQQNTSLHGEYLSTWTHVPGIWHNCGVPMPWNYNGFLPHNVTILNTMGPAGLHIPFRMSLPLVDIVPEAVPIM